jgi:predicted Zn-dependent protease with MMP-like domain
MVIIRKRKEDDMISLDEMEMLLESIVEEFPREIFKELNGGIILLPELKRNKIGNNLFIMGQYHKGGPQGRYISIFYGSFKRVYGHLNEEALRKKLTEVLKHEFTHHLESLAGERDLEIEDEKFINEYLRRNQ